MRTARTFLWLGLVLTLVLGAFSINAAQAFDVTGNFSQAKPELVSGFKLECGPTKGGPYPNVQDCGTPAIKADGTYDCVVKGLAYNPVYCVASNYDKNKVKIATSAEASLTVPVAPPANLKLVVTVQTVSKIPWWGKPDVKTTITRETTDRDVTEGTVSTWDARKREQVTTTTFVSG